jgi:mannonate dehydratase
MEQTWRWFGEQDPISLDHIRQAGATGVVTALHHIASGQPWRPEEIADRKAVLAAAGLKWSVCESIPVPDAIKLGGAGSRAAIDAWKISLAGLGRAGVAVVCYNFMPVVDWTRTDLAWRLPSGRALRFDLVDFIGYDVFVLERADAASNYDPRLVATARKRISAKTEAEISLLERNVIAGLPGGAEAQTRGSIARRIENFTGLSNDEMHENLAAFLREVVPVAEEVGVRLAIHPDDPPRSLFGLPRVVSTAEDARRILRAVVAMAREFAPRIHFAHLRNVALEPDGSFYEAEHLDGVVDMVALVEILLKEERAARAEGRRADIPMRPDHGHLLADDVAKRTNPGYSYIGRLKGLAELRGVMRALDARISA